MYLQTKKETMPSLGLEISNNIVATLQAHLLRIIQNVNLSTF